MPKDAHRTRDHFLDAATHLFSEHGFSGTSVADVANQLGVTKQAVLHHFGNKERLYGEVLQRTADELAERLRDEALDLAREIAHSAPLAVDSIRRTLRGALPEEIRRATDREKAEQDRLQKTHDWVEGTRAMTERREPEFEGR